MYRPLLSLLGSSATLLNIRNAKKHFEKLEKVEAPHSAILG